MNGADILSMDESSYTDMAITAPRDRIRFRTAVAKLNQYQSKNESEALYFEREKQYAECKSVKYGDSYNFPANMENWTPLDVFAFMKTVIQFHKNTPTHDRLMKFLKPVALSNVDGELLLQLSKSNTKVRKHMTYFSLKSSDHSVMFHADC